MADTLLSALFLGVIEGLTEFIPVSSTGHILLAGHFIGFQSSGRTFEVVIQLGAVLAILTVAMLLVGWRQHLRAVAWVTILAALPTSLVLLAKTGASLQ